MLKLQYQDLITIFNNTFCSIFTTKHYLV